jgi:Domain of unknown function (DUF1814).
MNDIYEYLKYTANLISHSAFGNKLILKGGSVLISKLIECQRTDLYRLTSDLDIHCDKKEVWIAFYNNIENILNNNDMGYTYKIVKRRSEEKGLVQSDSLVFNLIDGNKTIKFKIDMNIKSNNIITVEYSPILNMSTYDAYTMLSDKIASISSRTIFRRIKDLYDLAVLITLQDYSYSSVMKHIKVKHPNFTPINMLVQSNFRDLEHAYNAFEGIVNKPDIRYLVVYCSTFLEPIYNGNQGELLWDARLTRWMVQ